METANDLAGTSDGLALAALIVAIAVPIFVLLVSVGVTIVLHRRAIQRAADANTIAARALAIEEARLQREQDAFAQPLRFDPGGNRVFYQVLGTWPLEEVEFEFRNYAGAGGVVRKHKVPPGEVWIGATEFEEGGGLETPGPKEFVARVRWKRESASSWEDSGRYGAVKGKLEFKRLG